ncbi:MAG: hypothetical protein ACR5KV_05710 [Wolbachia sp.]
MASLTRNQYYGYQDLQNLLSRLGIKVEEVISQKFDDILKLVERHYKKLALKFLLIKTAVMKSGQRKNFRNC